MKQRLVMCAAFLHRPRAVLVDEPMVGLDPRGARLIKDVFRRMSERGVAILMSTHTLEVAQEMCDRISIILKGQIIARGTVDELRALAHRAAGGADDAPSAAHRRLPPPHRRQRAPGNRRSPVSGVSRVSLPAAAVVLGVAQPRAAARARRRDAGLVLRRRRARRRRRDLRRRVLADGAARRLRRFRRLPAPARPVVAVPVVPVVPRVQRHRHGAVDVFPLGRPAAAAGGAGLGAPRCSTRGSRGRSALSSWMVVVFIIPVLAGVGVGHCAPAAYYFDVGAGGHAVRDDPDRDRDGRHAAAGEHLPGPPRARHPDADGTAVRRQPRACCCG